jgi:hypothetical protein
VLNLAHDPPDHGPHRLRLPAVTVPCQGLASLRDSLLQRNQVLAQSYHSRVQGRELLAQSQDLLLSGLHLLVDPLPGHLAPQARILLHKPIQLGLLRGQLLVQLSPAPAGLRPVGGQQVPHGPGLASGRPGAADAHLTPQSGQFAQVAQPLALLLVQQAGQNILGVIPCRGIQQRLQARAGLVEVLFQQMLDDLVVDAVQAAASRVGGAVLAVAGAGVAARAGFIVLGVPAHHAAAAGALAIAMATVHES